MDAAAIPLLRVLTPTADRRGWGVAAYAAATAGLLIARALPWPGRIGGFAREVCLLLPAALRSFLVRCARCSGRAERDISDAVSGAPTPQ